MADDDEDDESEEESKEKSESCWKLQATTMPMHVYWHSGSL